LEKKRFESSAKREHTESGSIQIKRAAKENEQK